MNNIDIYFFFWNVGMRFKKILNFFGMHAGRKAITYYAEIHKSPVNIFIHKTLMPFCCLLLFARSPSTIENELRKSHDFKKLYLYYPFNTLRKRH